MEQVVREIAERLGFEAARIWPQVVAITWLTSLFWAVADPLMLAASVWGVFWAFRSARRSVAKADAAYTAAVAGSVGRYVSKLDYDPMGALLIYAAIGIVLSVLAVASLVGWPDALAGAIYPEAQTVLHLVKGVATR